MEPKQRKKHNIYNRIVSRSKNKTGYPGVRKYLGDYAAVLRYNGKTHMLGIKRTPEEAHKLYVRTCKALGIKVRVKP